ncbi:MAG: hypothetical protein RR623_10130 [Bacilli bacterium]
MAKWEVNFSINGKRTNQIVSAFSSIDARKIIEAQFSGSKIVIWNIIKVN